MQNCLASTGAMTLEVGVGTEVLSSTGLDQWDPFRYRGARVCTQACMCECMINIYINIVSNLPSIYVEINVFSYISDMLALSMNVARYFLHHHEKARAKQKQKATTRNGVERKNKTKKKHWNHCHHVSIGVWTNTSQIVTSPQKLMS